MPSSVTTSLPAWLYGCTYDANGGNDLRNSTVTAQWYDEGIVTGSAIGVLGGVTGGAGLLVTPGGGMTLNVQPGSYVVPNTATPTAGGYSSTLPASTTLTIAAPDPVNPRIDLVAATVTDNGNSTSSGQVQVITGIPATSPAVPATPANSIVLAQVAVGAGVSSIVAGAITDTRPFTCAAGGVLVAPQGTVPGYAGQLAYDRNTGRFYHNSGSSGSAQPRILPFPPVYATRNSDWTIPNSTGTLLSVNITTDGFTDIKVTTHVAGIYQNIPLTAQIVFTAWLDGNQLDEIDKQTLNSDAAGISHDGFTSVYCTSAATGDTPSAGNHTVFFKGQTGATNATFVRATAQRNAYLRVEPVAL